MKIVVQRVKEANVTVNGEVVGSIGRGLMVLLGVHRDDTPDKTEWLVNKLINLRCFADSEDKMNLNVQDIQGEIMIISQFTLYANCSEGRRPDFFAAAPPEMAEKIYNKFVMEVKTRLGEVQTGRFGARMQVSLINDGPVTFIIESAKS